MIYLYSGVPGSGKSLHAASDIRFALNRGRAVLGNFELSAGAPVRSLDHFRFYRNNELSPDLLVSFADEWWADSVHRFREDSILLVLDEVQLLFNSRRWADSDRLSWLEFFSQHRKYGYKVILIAQSAKMIDTQFRMLVEEEVNHRRVSSMGFFGFVAACLFLGRLFMQVSYLFQTSERLGMSFFVGRRKDMRMYDSYGRFALASGSGITQ